MVTPPPDREETPWSVSWSVVKENVNTNTSVDRISFRHVHFGELVLAILNIAYHPMRKDSMNDSSYKMFTLVLV